MLLWSFRTMCRFFPPKVGWRVCRGAFSFCRVAAKGADAVAAGRTCAFAHDRAELRKFDGTPQYPGTISSLLATQPR